MDINRLVENTCTIGSNGSGPYLVGGQNGLTRLEYFMLELTKAVVIATGRDKFDPKVIVNRAQTIFEVLKKRIEDIEQQGLISDYKS